jgi:hypothetical protein
MSLRDNAITLVTALLIGGSYYLGLINGYDRGTADGQATFSKYFRATQKLDAIQAQRFGIPVIEKKIPIEMQGETNIEDAGIIGFFLEWRRKPTIEWAKALDRTNQTLDLQARR